MGEKKNLTISFGDRNKKAAILVEFDELLQKNRFSYRNDFH